MRSYLCAQGHALVRNHNKEVTGAECFSRSPVLDLTRSIVQVCLCSGRDRDLQGCLATHPSQMISFCRGQRALPHAVVTSDEDCGAGV